MIVTNQSLESVVDILSRATQIGLDTETTGLRTFHGDRIFSLILAADIDDERHQYYFNFWNYEGLRQDLILDKGTTFKLLQKLIFDNPSNGYFMHNAKFDLHMLAAEGAHIAGWVHCTKAIGRVSYNEHQKYDLDSSLERIDLEKDPAVEAYIEEHKLFELVKLEHKAQREKRKFYYKVPFHIIVPYGLKDACGTLDLGYHQLEEIARLDSEIPDNVPAVANVYLNEVRLTKTVQRMEANGCRIDVEYCKEAIAFEEVAMETSLREIEETSGIPFKNSAKCLSQVFKGHEHQFSHGEPSKKTGKRELSFDADALEKISHPLVDSLLRYRSAKNRLSFYKGFLYHRDANNIVHPSFNPDVARHGRFSSSNPNFTNLANNEETEEGVSEDSAFSVRKAVIPRPGNIFILPDMIAFEYRMALEYACRVAGRVVPLAQMVLDGMDFHTATIQLVKEKGYDISRRKAKVCNFLVLYAGGPKALAQNLKCSLPEAQEIFYAVIEACPELQTALKYMQSTAERRGFIFNHFGRRCFFPDKRFAYKAGNYVISGGCADVIKLAMNRIDDVLQSKKLKSFMVCMIHDSIELEVPLGPEIYHVPQMVSQVMESSFQYEYIPMKVEMAYSAESLGHEKKGWPQ